ncbi:unnamed protein product [Darwinula stevensoni]|uniref:Coiled-coil domain-containing protein 12 n=1 Tax=Darwinula stevensoni TaxID=69355 RepID=A0A7R8XB74_9CRUS|nr:unnamed protein product [Darwinula stevensoni]CAG0892577.1 unnamed protein product [Darwinula stevensoni]
MSTSEEKVGHLEEEARKRKERLLRLKRKASGFSEEDDADRHSAAPSMPLPKPVFRSYKPTDEGLAENVMERIQPLDVDDQVKDQLELGKSYQLISDQVDLTSLAPRKPDWDLKRDVTKKLEKLEKKTQQAIAQLIRERLRSGEGNFAMAVNAGATAEMVDED